MVTEHGRTIELKRVVFYLELQNSRSWKVKNLLLLPQKTKTQLSEKEKKKPKELKIFTRLRHIRNDYVTVSPGYLGKYCFRSGLFLERTIKFLFTSHVEGSMALNSKHQGMKTIGGRLEFDLDKVPSELLRGASGA